MLAAHAQRRCSHFGLLALGLCATVGCMQPDERRDFGTYPGPAIDADSGASGGGSTGFTTGASSGTTSGVVPPGVNTTGSGSSGGSTGFTTGLGNTGASGTGSSGSGSSGTSNGGTSNGGTSSGGTSNGGTSNGGTSNGGTTGSANNGGSNGATTGASTGSTTGGTGVSALTFKVTTTALGGRYQPKNIGAIWITTGAGAFVRTLEKWAGIRVMYLTRFATETNRNSVDAMTSATLTNHRAHSVTWDLKDLNGQVVPDGPYNIVIETTDKDATGDSLSIPFTKGAPVSLSPPNTTHYVGMNLQIN